MTLNFIGFYHYIDMVCATGVGIIVGMITGYALACGKKK